MNAVSRNREGSEGQMDWLIIDMARRDGPLSLKPDGLVARIGRALFGISAARRLANDGMEALRRFSVRAWFWDYIPASEVQAFLDAGYSVTDAERILAYVGQHRGFKPTLLLSPV